MNLQVLLTKYGDTIQEEVNVKELGLLSGDILPKKQIKPLGKQLSGKYGKQTALIIQSGKDGNVEELWDGRVLVRGADQEWTLLPDEYEIAYEGNLPDNCSIMDGVAVQLDLTVTPELRDEGVARECSRQINQLRKDANFRVDQRVLCQYFAETPQIQLVISQYADYLQSEGLLASIEPSTSKDAAFVKLDTDYGAVRFSLQP